MGCNPRPLVRFVHWLTNKERIDDGICREVRAQRAEAGHGTRRRSRRGEIMSWTIAIVCVALWIFGMAKARRFGGFLHLLLVIAAAMVLIGPRESAPDTRPASQEKPIETSILANEAQAAVPGPTPPPPGQLLSDDER
jgi:putative exporter of polyketide antibiotics